jgi:hypothetical protein
VKQVIKVKKQELKMSKNNRKGLTIGQGIALLLPCFVYPQTIAGLSASDF